jgi:hypothetical protein
MNRLALFLGLVVWMGCSADDYIKDIKLETQETQLLQVLYGKISVGDTFLNITSYTSKKVTSSDPVDQQTNPTFTVKINGLSVQNTAILGFTTTLKSSIKENDQIEIVSKLQGYPDALCVITMPKKAKVARTAFTPSGVLDRDGDARSRLSVFYEETGVVALEVLLQNNAGNTLILESIEKFSADALKRSSVLFDMKGQNKTDITFGPINTMVGQRLTISSITLDYFLWSKKAESINDAGFLPFSTPFDQHTNIKGGLGIIYGVNDLVLRF